jgi:hypothetical protein
MRRVAALLCLACVMPVWAGQSESEAAVAEILFAEDMENASYTLRGDGFVDILFGVAVSDQDYRRVLDKLKSHPAIPGVLAGKGKTNFCPVR